MITGIPQGTAPGRYQQARPGSYAEVEHVGFTGSDNGFEVEFFTESYLPAAGHPQTLIALSDGKRVNQVAVLIDRDGKIGVRIDMDGVSVFLPFDFQVTKKRWVHAQLRVQHSEVRLCLSSVSQYAQVSSFQHTFVASIDDGLEHWHLTHVTLAGRPSTGKRSLGIVDFFNGKLDGVSIKALGKQPRVLAAYDFSLKVGSNTIVDTSGAGRNGTLHNAPTRAVRGFNWDGSEVDWSKASFGYGAIHFHEDDLDDAAWATDFTISIPRSARSGAYAVEVRGVENPNIFDKIPFFVRPSSESTAKVALVLSTFTYLAYANEHMWDQSRSSRLEVPSTGFEIRQDEDLARMQRRSDLGLSLYDVHRDGSGMVYSTSKRPILNVRPGYVHWAFQRPREFSADLLMIGFLEQHLGLDYDVITDHDMHTHGVAAVSKYNTIITGCHPEYHSVQTLDAWTHFAQRGGNLMYLGGNGFYWVATPVPADPHRLEVRRGDQGVRTFVIPGGERHHSGTRVLGGLWRSRGRPANVLFGVGCCGEGLGPGVPYQRTPAASDPEYSWIFSGIAEDELLGVHGFGGGASGDEIDRFDLDNGSPPQAVVLASSTGHSDEFGLFPEEIGFPMVDTLGTQTDKIRSDIVIYRNSGGGCVFSVGSINWYSSLGWDGYSNNIAKLTLNLLKRFTAGDREI